MFSRRNLSFILVACAIFVSAIPTSAAPVNPNTVGVVVQYPDGRIETRTVTFSEPTITGLQALQRAGLSLELSGTLVCSIAGSGCPSADCFCGCPAPFDPCYYWSYFHWNGHAWQFAPVGAGEHPLQDGDVDGLSLIHI